MAQNTLDDPPGGPFDGPKDGPPDEAPPETAKDMQPPVEEFPEKLYCHQCRRVFPVKSLRAKANTLLTEAALVCPRCRRKLRRMKLKDWYDHYVQGQPKDFTLDTHGFFHQDPPGQGPEAPEGRQNRPQPPPPRGPANRDPRQQQGRRNGGRRGDRGQSQFKDSRPDQKKSPLPQNVKAYRLPKRRRR